MVFSLADDNNVTSKETAVWSVEYTGGMSIAANALCRIERMFAEDSRSGVRQIAVFLTDGSQPLMERETFDATMRLNNAGVEMFVVGKNASDNYVTQLNIIHCAAMMYTFKVDYMNDYYV